MSDLQNTPGDSNNPPQPQDVVQGQLTTQPIQSSVSGAGENLQCQWQGCGERCSSAEALYEHVCERHVGRKSTNNLNLTCAWGQCRTTTVKRDHITSHIRVHVPLKPHKCEFCGKAFKRPQDLKKHVKTHADDSVIMRSPEPGAGSRQSQGGMPTGIAYTYPSPMDGSYLTPPVPTSYYAPMPPQDYGAGQHANQYYQPHPQVQTGQHPGYGPVTYYNAPAPQATYDYETRKRGYDALDHFFGQVKRREFDPVNYANVSRRLFELQGLQLPQIIPANLGMPAAYQPVSVGAGGYGNDDPIQSYSLPPMGNAKTREDLTSIDQILEQMQATIYENDNHNYPIYNTSNSPPQNQMSSAASHNTAAGLLQNQHHGSVASTADSASTPGLTPSSAHSYTSGLSPTQAHSTPTSGAMYPSLPSNASDMAYAAANAATISGMYSDDDRRHFGGDRLQRAAPAKKERDEMDVTSDGSVTPPASTINKQAKSKGKNKASPKDSVIDPALSAEAGTPKSDAKEEDREQIWVQNMRLIEWMREVIKKKLERGDYDEAGDAAKEEKHDTEMGGTEDDKADSKSDAQQLYPVLKAVEGGD